MLIHKKSQFFFIKIFVMYMHFLEGYQSLQLKKIIKCSIFIRKWTNYYCLFDAKFHRKWKWQMVPLTLRCARCFFLHMPKHIESNHVQSRLRQLTFSTSPLSPNIPKNAAKSQFLPMFGVMYIASKKHLSHSIFLVVSNDFIRFNYTFW